MSEYCENLRIHPTAAYRDYLQTLRERGQMLLADKLQKAPFIVIELPPEEDGSWLQEVIIIGAEECSVLSASMEDGRRGIKLLIEEKEEAHVYEVSFDASRTPVFRKRTLEEGVGVYAEANMSIVHEDSISSGLVNKIVGLGKLIGQPQFRDETELRVVRSSLIAVTDMLSTELITDPHIERYVLPEILADEIAPIQKGELAPSTSRIVGT